MSVNFSAKQSQSNNIQHWMVLKWMVILVEFSLSFETSTRCWQKWLNPWKCLVFNVPLFRCFYKKKQVIIAFSRTENLFADSGLCFSSYTAFCGGWVLWFRKQFIFTCYAQLQCKGAPLTAWSKKFLLCHIMLFYPHLETYDHLPQRLS